jgi:hypothetical protein
MAIDLVLIMQYPFVRCVRETPPTGGEHASETLIPETRKTEVHISVPRLLVGFAAK